jgi:hypothetical protein
VQRRPGWELVGHRTTQIVDRACDEEPDQLIGELVGPGVQPARICDQMLVVGARVIQHVRTIGGLELLAVHHHPDRERPVDSPLSLDAAQGQARLDTSGAGDELPTRLQFAGVLTVDPDGDRIVGPIVAEHVDLVEQQGPTLVVPRVRRVLGQELPSGQVARTGLHRCLEEVPDQDLGVHPRTRGRYVPGRLMSFE